MYVSIAEKNIDLPATQVWDSRKPFSRGDIWWSVVVVIFWKLLTDDMDNGGQWTMAMGLIFVA